MNLEAKKKLLVIACTCDRLEAEIRWNRHFGEVATPLEWAGRIGRIGSLLGPLLPRWMRLCSSVLSMFTKR